jgi:peroxiredoxin
MALVVSTIVGVLTLSTAAQYAATAREGRPAVGGSAKDFTLKTLSDKPVQLTALLKDGPVVVLMLRGWVGYQCPFCTRQVGEFIGSSKDFAAAGAKIVMVYPIKDETEKTRAQEFVKNMTLPENFLLVMDPGMKTVADYGLRWEAPGETAYPSTLVVGKDGKFVMVKISGGHGDRAAAKDVLEVLKK